MYAEGCPRCGRANAPHRASCLYCGQELSPTAPPPGSPGRELPPELDKMVRQALTGGSISKVKSALSEWTQTPAQPRPEPVPRPELAGRNEPELRLLPPPPRAPGPSPSPAVAAPALERLQRAVLSLQQGGSPADQRAAIDSARRALQELEARLAPSPPPGPPAAATFHRGLRGGWLLIVEGPGAAERAAGLAIALKLDNATARQLALCRFPRVASRSDDPHALHDAASRLADLAGLASVVVSRAELEAEPSPLGVLSLVELDQLSVSPQPVWMGAEALHRADARLEDLLAVVSGEVVLRRWRISRDRRGGITAKDSSERRLSVLDLHAPDCVYRVAEQGSELAAWPLADPHSTLRSMKRLEEELERRFPRALRSGSRSLPAPEPLLGAEMEGAEQVETSGWAGWEEHSRTCRVFARAARAYRLA